MKHSTIEILVGFIVILVALTLFVFAYTVSNSLKIKDGYTLKASFHNAEGVVKGSDVMLAGIKIGSVTSIALDTTSFSALLTININNNIKLPKDTSIAIVTSGILGSKYIAVIPGSSQENLARDDQIKYTQSAINIESLIGKLMYSFGSASK